MCTFYLLWIFFDYYWKKNWEDSLRHFAVFLLIFVYGLSNFFLEYRPYPKCFTFRDQCIQKRKGCVRRNHDKRKRGLLSPGKTRRAQNNPSGNCRGVNPEWKGHPLHKGTWMPRHEVDMQRESLSVRGTLIFVPVQALKRWWGRRSCSH